MLGKHDIIKEIGKGICIYPLNENNIKENSVNLSASEFAWSTTSGEIYEDKNEMDKNKKFSLTQDSNHDNKLIIKSRDSAVITEGINKYIILLPLSTTLIETKEVLSLSSYIGGTYHSKVGLVSKGLGHIGTMVGPNFSGDSLIAIHNISKELVVIKVGETFVSVVFHYLDTPYLPINPTTSGHTDKFAELGLYVPEEQLSVLNEDWKKKFDDVSSKMCKSEEYKNFIAKAKEEKNKKIKKFFCKKNIITLFVTGIVFFGLFFIAHFVDNKAGNNYWTDRYISVGCSGVFVAIISKIISFLKNNVK